MVLLRGLKTAPYMVLLRGLKTAPYMVLLRGLKTAPYMVLLRGLKTPPYMVLLRGLKTPACMVLRLVHTVDDLCGARRVPLPHLVHQRDRVLQQRDLAAQRVEEAVARRRAERLGPQRR